MSLAWDKTTLHALKRFREKYWQIPPNSSAMYRDILSKGFLEDWQQKATTFILSTIGLIPYSHLSHSSQSGNYNTEGQIRTKTKGAWEHSCYSSHASRPSHCPVQLNEQHRSPRRYEYATPHTDIGHLTFVKCHTSKGMRNNHIPRTSTVAKLMTVPESCEVSKRQEQSVK